MTDMTKRVIKPLTLLIIGGLVYYLLEIIFRGYSHWTMIALGGVCFVAIGQLNENLDWNLSILTQMLVGSLIITSLEFFTGIIVNIILQWNVWDYSDMPLNVYGQICIPFSLLWYVVSGVAIVLDDYLRYFLFHEEKPHYSLRSRY